MGYMAAITNSLMKSRSPQRLSCIPRQQFYWGIFLIGLVNFVHLSTTFFIQRF